MLKEPRKAYVLLGVEPELDTHDPQQAVAAMRSAELVVALSGYQHAAVDYAHVLLPIGLFTETAGTYVSSEGRVQSFSGVVRSLGESRPAWKVLRVLGSPSRLPSTRSTFQAGRDSPSERTTPLKLCTRPSLLT